MSDIGYNQMRRWIVPSPSSWKTLIVAVGGWMVATALSLTIVASQLGIGPFALPPEPPTVFTPIRYPTEPPTFTCQEQSANTADSSNPFHRMLYGTPAPAFVCQYDSGGGPIDPLDAPAIPVP